jgi:hypothetical protein
MRSLRYLPTTCEGPQRLWVKAAMPQSWIVFTNPDATTQPGLCCFDLRDVGKITRIRDFWPDRYELPSQRAPLVERY